MKTANVHFIPKIEEKRMRDYVFILEDYELAFPKPQLESITRDWNNGTDIEVISKRYKRPVEEIFLALFHQAIQEKITRPFA